MKTQELIRQQTKFMDDKAQLELWMIRQGYFICPGELRRSTDPLPCVACGRSQSRQEMLVAAGRSWTMNSRHLDGLAQDYTIFYQVADGSLKEISSEEYVVIGRYWEKLSPENIHSLKKGDDDKDRYHFERRV